MPKDRTQVLVRTPIGAVSKEAKISASMFMVTINPNIRFDDLESPEAKEMIIRLKAMTNFLLEKKNILASLKFKDRPAKEGVPQVTLTREQHLDKIVSISKDRSGAVEWGTKFHRLHAHLEFIIEHRTFLHLNKDFYERVASAYIQKPPKKIHVNMRGSTRAEGYKKYVTKGANEDTAHFFDKSADSFYKDESEMVEV